MTKSVFQAGFVWRIVENKWNDFERVFYGFDVHRVAYLSDEEIESLLDDPNIIRHHTKLRSTRENAAFLLEIIDEFGSVGKYFADFPSAQYVELLIDLKKRASRMGGTSAQYFLRRMGKDSFLLTRDVVTALVREQVVDRSATSKRDLQAAQSAFNTWCDQGQRSLTEVSRILAWVSNHDPHPRCLTTLCLGYAICSRCWTFIVTGWTAASKDTSIKAD